MGEAVPVTAGRDAVQPLHSAYWGDRLGQVDGEHGLANEARIASPQQRHEELQGQPNCSKVNGIEDDSLKKNVYLNSSGEKWFKS